MRGKAVKKQKAVYAASLDPITNGHVNIIERMAPLYDELVVVVAVDPKKTYTFNIEERVNMARVATKHIPNSSVDVCVGQYTIKFAESINACVIIRGLRNIKDLDEEFALAEENRKICPSIETIWVPCLPSLMYVSSSMVKGHVGVDPDWEKQVARSVPTIVVEKLKEKFTLNKARKHWVELMVELGNPKASWKIFDSLVKRYSEPHRTYHILNHIVDMLEELEEVKGQITNLVAIKLAIWFHDSIYEPESKNHSVIASNEARSSYRAELDMKELGLPSDQIRLVCGDCHKTGLIMMTSHVLPVCDYDAQLLVDIDLSILGKSKTEFDLYEVNIRKEYNFVPEKTFRSKRSKLLKSFLDRRSIYLTSYFRGKYESDARKNLKRSIKQLSK